MLLLKSWHLWQHFDTKNKRMNWWSRQEANYANCSWSTATWQPETCFCPWTRSVKSRILASLATSTLMRHTGKKLRENVSKNWWRGFVLGSGYKKTLSKLKQNFWQCRWSGWRLSPWETICTPPSLMFGVTESYSGRWLLWVTVVICFNTFPNIISP